MRTQRTAWRKLREWARRYLPCETVGTAAEFGGAAIAYAITGSLAAAAVTATVGASVGYYATAYLTALRCASTGPQRCGPPRWLRANLLALRSVAVEFGPAEIVDSAVIRPLAFYVGPGLFGNVLAGWIFGKFVSDLAFYAIAIVSYERFGSVLLRIPATAKEVDGEPVASVATA